MFDDKTEDNTPVLKELDSTITQEPTLEELNQEEDHLEFTNDTTWTFTADERTKENDKVSLEEPVLTGGSSSSGTTGKVSEVSPTSVKARVAEIEKSIIQKSISLGKRKYTPMQRLKPEDVLPGGPKWERIGDRVIRRYKGTNKPEGVWPEVWQGTSHKERNILVKEAKEFREQYENNTLTEAPLEGIRPTGSSTGEGAWPGAPAAQYSAPATAQKEITRHIVEFCTSENSKIGDERYTNEGCSVMRCSLKDDVTTNAGLKRAIDGVSKPGCLLWASMPCIGGPLGSTSTVTNLGGQRNSTLT